MAGSAIIQGAVNSLLTLKKTVNINSANSDNEVAVPWSVYIVRRVIVTNASKDLSSSGATLGVFTAAAGGGTTVVAAATLTTLDTAVKFSDRTIAAVPAGSILTAASLFIRNVVADGGAATVDVYIFGEILP